MKAATKTAAKAVARRSLPFALILITSSCAVDPGGPEAGEGSGAGEAGEAGEAGGHLVSRSAALLLDPPDKCPANVCGMNSADLTDWWSHELNLDNQLNAEGYALVNLRKGGAYYRVNVAGGRITAERYAGNMTAPQTLSGYTLIGAELRIRKPLPDGTTSYRSIIIDEVARSADYWARHPDGTPTPNIETYKFLMRLDNSPLMFPLCMNGAQFYDVNSPVRPMGAHHALVFEGERINVDRLTIAPQLNTRWFNFGCAETALAKLHLTGHTKAAYHDADFVTSIDERQTMLKMITADYCGTGNSFTVSGQSLRWTDDRGTMTLSPGFGKVLEARWTPSGAVCINTPRADAHPTAASRERFEYGAAYEIAHECYRPTCGSTTATYHLLSWNPTPFTN